MRWMLALSLLISVPLAACSASSTGSTGAPDGGGAGGNASGGSGGTTQGAGGVALAVTSASNPLQINNTSPSGGNAFEELDITLQNKSSATPVSTNFALFTLATDQSLVLDASTLSGSVTPQCSPTTAVAVGGSFACKLVFEVPTGQKAMTLLYDDKQGHKASAAVPAPPPALALCEQFMTLQAGPAGPCNQCLAQAEHSATCGTLANAASSICGAAVTCQNACNGDAGVPPDPATACSCYKGCSSAACWSADQNLIQCALTACASSC